MDRFRVKAYTIEFYEDEVEAENAEEAEERFVEKWENAEICCADTQFFFDDEDGFELLEGVYLEQEGSD